MSSSGDFDARSASMVRETSETSVRIELQLDQAETYKNETGIGFLDHMLDLFAKHGGFGLQTFCDGDLHVDEHHTVEDVAISLGDAFREALGDKTFIRRFGHAYVPMDDALARATIDLSGRFYLHYQADFDRDRVGDLSVEMVEHFWHAFAEHARCNLHIEALYGKKCAPQDRGDLQGGFPRPAGRCLQGSVFRQDAIHQGVPLTPADRLRRQSASRYLLQRNAITL